MDPTKEAQVDRYGVLKSGDKFVLAFLDSQLKNPFMRTGEPMSEEDMRAELGKAGLPPAKIEELIAKAK
jgi:hypothetical protein